MSDQETRSESVNWSCALCNAAVRIAVGARYCQCATCGAAFRLGWRGGQIENYFVLDKLGDVIDSQPEEEELRADAEEMDLRLRRLSEQIRRLEMSKGGERLRVLAIFVVIISGIFLVFRMSVGGVGVIIAPGVQELSVLGAGAFSLFVVAVFGLRKSALVRKCNRLINERDRLEEELENVRAALGLHFNDSGADAEPQPGGTDPGAQSGTEDIIERFASRRKQGRSRLNIRDDES